jgi:ABC-type multidrug transport system ATPase subunit
VTAGPPSSSSAGIRDGANPPAAAMIELRRLTKAFGRKIALRGLDLSVAPGESLVLFGPNGAGKTTLIRILSSLSRPTSGSVYIGGLDLKTHAEGIRRHLGVVSHAPLLYDSLTAEENLRFFGRLYGVADLESRVTLLLEQVGLAGRRKDLVRIFSRGMTQRLAIARALLHDPEILLLDEPDTGLDPQAAEMLHGLLAELSGRSEERRAGSVVPLSDAPPSSASSARTIVTVTHNLERGLALADRVVILANGRIVFDAPAGALTNLELRPLYDKHVGGGR